MYDFIIVTRFLVVYVRFREANFIGVFGIEIMSSFDILLVSIRFLLMFYILSYQYFIFEHLHPIL